MFNLEKANETIQRANRSQHIAALAESILEYNEVTVQRGKLIVGYKDSTDELCVIVDVYGEQHPFFVSTSAEKLAEKLYSYGVRASSEQIKELTAIACTPVEIIHIAEYLLEREAQKPVYKQSDGDAEALVEVIETARFVCGAFGMDVRVENIVDIGKLNNTAADAILIQEWASTAIEAMRVLSAVLYANLLARQKKQAA